MKSFNCLGIAALLVCAALAACSQPATDKTSIVSLSESFLSPPDDARPGVYWYFMDGNLSKEGITKDLESMRDQGIGYVVFLEVNVGVPRGKVDFMSPEWVDIFKHIVSECERVGIKIVLGIGPGWTGSGGPWVKGEQSMRHLMASRTDVSGGQKIQVTLPVPAPNPPYFGKDSFTPKMLKDWQDYYEDVSVLAFPTPSSEKRMADIQEKGLFIRHPYSSMKGVRPYFPAPEGPLSGETEEGAVDVAKVIDITDKMLPDGTLTWDAPEGEWTILRMGARNNGASTRPAPVPGVGMECDKFDEEALRAHLSNFTDKLFEACGGSLSNKNGGIELLHMDSWEMGAQNWNQNFREEFIKRRGYDPLPYFPAYNGFIVGDSLMTERFLWDVRKTAQDLVIENHVGAVKRYAREHGLKVSIEPYDMNPTADLELAVAADMPMAEFWSDGFGFNTTFAPAEGTSAAHLLGQNVVPAESFTAQFDAWRQYPGAMKNQTDWALAAGINRLMFHTFQHQCLPDSIRPGMTMGPYGVHWDRGQTWWTMSHAYHTYIGRSQYLLQRGRTVADVLYLAPESTPHVFRAPDSAYDEAGTFMPDRKGYSFDGCPPSMLASAKVKGGNIVFPSGATYNLLVLPDYPTATPALLKEIIRLAKAGATIVGKPFKNSPSLSDYPACDEEVARLSCELFASSNVINYDGPSDNLYPPYEYTSAILSKMTPPDFVSEAGCIRFTHRTLPAAEIYFVSNRTGDAVSTTCSFRATGRAPELWDPMVGLHEEVATFSDDGTITKMPLRFEPHEGYFIVFPKDKLSRAQAPKDRAEAIQAASLEGPWTVRFDPEWGGPEEPVTITELFDWTESPDLGIKYYSGTATYDTDFTMEGLDPAKNYKISLGDVKAMAQVFLNDKNLGVVWTEPWTISTSNALVEGNNHLRVIVVNLWQNRLIGDEALPKEERHTFTTWHHYSAEDQLLPSGLLGPVKVLSD
jgi:hypothetical protein